MQRHRTLARSPTREREPSDGPDLDFAARLYAEAQAKKENLKLKQEEAAKEQEEQDRRNCRQFTANRSFAGSPRKAGEAAADSAVPFADRLYGEAQVKQQRLSEKLELAERQFQEDNTFKPSLNCGKGAHDKGITSDMHARNEVWDKNRQEKMEKERARKLEAELADATFQPQISEASRAFMERGPSSSRKPSSPPHGRLYRSAVEKQQSLRSRIEQEDLLAREQATRGANERAAQSPAEQRDASVRLTSPLRTYRGARGADGAAQAERLSATRGEFQAEPA